MTVLKPCPFCRLAETYVVDNSHSYAVKCRVCYTIGPIAHSSSAAIESWNSSHVGMIDNDELRRQQRFELVKAALPDIISSFSVPNRREHASISARMSIEVADAVLKKLEEK